MKNLLIVDDNEDNLYLLRVLLESRGYFVRQGYNGSEALISALASPPDMIISDILMPIIDGFTLCRIFKADPRLKKIPFVFYTATYTDPRDEALAFDIGASAFILKPTEPDEFLRRIEPILSAGQSGILKPPRQIQAKEETVLKEYNEVLIRKLEHKMLKLEQINKTLAAEIEARNKIEAALRESEERYRSLFENSLDGVLLTIPNDRVLEANPAACKIFGRSEEDLRRTGHNDLIDTTDPRFSQALAERDRTGRFSGELTGLRKDGIKFPCEISCIVFQDSEGKPKAGMIIRDITQRRQAESQRETALAEIRKLNEDLEKTVAERTAELTETVAKLEEINRVFVGRELKMVELKKRIEELEK